MRYNYPGARYEEAIRALPEIIEKAKAGDRAARSAVVHAYETATFKHNWPERMRELARSLRPLGGIYQVEQTVNSLFHYARMMDDLSTNPYGGDALGSSPVTEKADQ